MPLPGTSRIKDRGADAVQLTIDYVKQEALGPLKATGRFVVAGLAATALWAMGTVFLLVGVLRLLQTQTGSALSGNLSWVPYAAVTVLAAAVVAVAAWRITAGPGARRQPEVAARVAPLRLGRDDGDGARSPTAFGTASDEEGSH